MTNFKKLAVTLGVLVTFAVPTVAAAAQVGGGTWYFGVGYTGTYGYSNYHHPSRSHTATVQDGNYYSSVRNSAGEWAKASITKIPPTGMSYYWGY
ncbi:lactococcin 972 family bacteriocin [Leuconostoc lactis]|uniref:lactococcin 972 family bacteriocin n=1 Tax=Leuconostoc lactis TaxID=1246 RepID=UPI0015F6C029|nr:lactococcin 972 family bacteriocin [Leuconostoc lactis]MBA5813371.1 lactococcin 972 family bacteriocin [Leuconostoc lactis]MBU7537817.1 lactococcin 972 family bacteriocin [Leuconostoc lactis]